MDRVYWCENCKSFSIHIDPKWDYCHCVRCTAVYHMKEAIANHESHMMKKKLEDMPMDVMQ